MKKTICIIGAIIIIASCKKNSVPPAVVGTVTDIDGNVYNTISIGSQIWMTENLKTTRYKNGDTIINGNDKSIWFDSAVTAGLWCDFNSDSANENIYGKFYNWYAVSDPRGLAPQGWHVPSDAEWKTLSNYLGGDESAGGKMKSASSLWAAPNANASNSSGFGGLPEGYRSGDGTLFLFYGEIGCWWSSTESDLHDAWERILSNDSGYLASGGCEKDRGMSVRCIKD